MNNILVEAGEAITVNKTRKKGLRDRERLKCRTKKSKKWWCTLLTILVKSRNHVSRRAKDQKVSLTEKNKLRCLLKETNAKIQRITRLRKSHQAWLDRQKLIEEFLKHPNLFWREVNNRRNAQVKMSIDMGFLRTKYHENFNSLCQTSNSKFIEAKMLDIVNKYADKVRQLKTNYNIDKRIIEEILKNLKNGKKVGKNRISNEMLKYSRHTQISSIVASMFSSMLNQGYCPRNINVGAITTIIKDAKGDNTAFDNSRPITVSETMSMILEMFIMIDINKHIKLNKHQYGFRANSSCAHAV
jgi:hypothetical protein